MAFAAVYFLVYPVWRSQFLVEIWFTEDGTPISRTRPAPVERFIRRLMR